MNVAKTNEVSSLAWLSGEDSVEKTSSRRKFEQVDVSLGRRHIPRSEGFIRRVYRRRWNRSVEDKNFDEAASGRKVG